MNKLQYSNNALNVLSEFHGKRHVVYVEGIDDILFWKYILSQNGLHNVHIKEAGGNNEIEKLVHLILNEEIHLIVARDSHYCDILNRKRDHPRILYTFGYSIENSLFSPICIAFVVESYSKAAEDCLEEIEKWFEEFCGSLQTLIAQDIANIRYEKSLSIMSDSCARFLTTTKSHKLSKSKIQDFTNHNIKNFSNKEIDSITKLVSNYKKGLRYLLRGHFVQPGLRNLIKNCVKKKTGKDIPISNDSLLAHLLSIFYIHCKDTPDLNYLKSQINRLKKILK